MPNTLNKRYFNIWLDLGQAERLEGIAAEKGIDVVDVVQEIVKPVLAGEDEATTGQFVLLRIPALAYRQHLQWFDGDTELAKASMVGSVVVSGEEFAEALRKSGGN